MTLTRTLTLLSLLCVVAVGCGAPPSSDAELVDEHHATVGEVGGLVGSPLDTGLAVVLPVLRARRRTRIDVVVLAGMAP